MRLSQSQKIPNLLRRSHRSPGLKTFPAKNRPPLCRPERDRGFFPALRTVRPGLRSHRSATPATGCACTSPLRALGLAAFASLRFVLESFVGEEHLFSRRKYKLGTTLRTLQHPIVEFHERSPGTPTPAGDGSLAHVTSILTDTVSRPVLRECRARIPGPACDMCCFPNVSA
jgi:hypothetical protein